MLQGLTPCPSPPADARRLAADETLIVDKPVVACFDGFAAEATRLMEAAARLSEARSGRERWEHGSDAVQRLDAAGADLSGYLARVWQMFAARLPEQAADTLATTHPSTRERLIPGTGWTGFVLNRDVNLNYHRDTSNNHGWTAILAMRHRATGGWLHFPEHDVWSPMEHGQVILFPGLTTWHGVSPISLEPGGRRWTLVSYPKRHVPRLRVYPSR